MNDLPMTRREFVRGTGGLGFLAFSGFAPSFLARSALAQTPAPGRDRSILVIVQLAGGNDGLNTVVPFSDDRYHRLRPTLALREGLHRLNDDLGLHPACGDLAALHEEGKLAIVQNVGYPNPNRSHFRSTEIWETAGDGEDAPAEGWLGRYFDNACAGRPGQPDPAGIHVGDSVPQSFLGRAPHVIHGLRARGGSEAGDDGVDNAYEALLRADHNAGPASYLQHTMMNALVTEQRIQRVIADYRPGSAYPGTRLAQSLRRVAALINADFETRVFFVSQSGYDTHANQLHGHARLLAELSGALAAFQADLAAHRRDDQVMTMTFSEFGRRPAENGSAGTDHGTAAPLFVMGSKVRGGLVGQPPGLDVGPKEDLRFSTDFRRVYATVLDRWLESDSSKVLGGRYQPVPFV